ncbi:MAG: hypothetical protein Kow0098_24450 [Ignavibacteriaceae bacterium]
MKKILFTIATLLIFSVQIYSQVEDRFGYFTDQDIEDFVKPLATTLGTAFNSGGYHSAKVADLFGFGISIQGMLILVPDDQLTFTPQGASGATSFETATIWGNEGAEIPTSEGWLVYPDGVDLSSIPVGYPQIYGSLMGTEVMVRYLPKIDLGETDIGFVGFGIKHSISRYIPLAPVDVAVQFMYNSFSMKDLVDASNIAINVHASKGFGLFTLYGGLQYESTSFDLEYTYTDPNNTNPALKDQTLSVSIDGDNNFRATIGGALQLAVVVLNVDFSIGSQSVVSSGLSFEF